MTIINQIITVRYSKALTAIALFVGSQKLNQISMNRRGKVLAIPQPSVVRMALLVNTSLGKEIEVYETVGISQ